MSIVCLGARDSEAAQMSLRYVTALEYIKVLQYVCRIPPPIPTQFALVPHDSASRCRTHQKHAAGMHRNILENIDVEFFFQRVILSDEILLRIC